MKKTLLIDPFSGTGGDMLLAALIDAGAPIENIREQVLGIHELMRVAVDIEPVRRGHFAAHRLRVELPEDKTHRGLSDVVKIIDGAVKLSDTVRARARESFERLATVEARMHGTTPDEVHFHEVGALDAILDIVGFYVAAESLGIEEFVYTRLVLGGGETGSAHGAIPIPAPATLELLAGHPVSFSGRDEELVTPTAAAIIATVFRPLGSDARVVGRSYGYGAGSRESDGLPNILRVVVGDIATEPRSLSVIRCTIDDMNPEFYGHTMETLFEAGALEVYFHPVIMKKNRPGVEVTVICHEHDSSLLADRVLAQTTTLGVRVAREERVELERRKETVETPLGKARVKVALVPGGSERMSPEYESCRELAASSGRSLADVYDIVRAAWRASRGE